MQDLKSTRPLFSGLLCSYLTKSTTPIVSDVLPSADQASIIDERNLHKFLEVKKVNSLGKPRSPRKRSVLVENHSGAYLKQQF